MSLLAAKDEIIDIQTKKPMTDKVSLLSGTRVNRPATNTLSQLSGT
jgi:hypothetical protein